MAWCHQATSHYLNQRLRPVSPYVITRLKWVKLQAATTYSQSIQNTYHFIYEVFSIVMTVLTRTWINEDEESFCKMMKNRFARQIFACFRSWLEIERSVSCQAITQTNESHDLHGQPVLRCSDLLMHAGPSPRPTHTNGLRRHPSIHPPPHLQPDYEKHLKLKSMA